MPENREGVPDRPGPLLSPLVHRARQQVRSAAAIAALLALLSLVVGARTWNERHYLDLEILLGLIDSILTLILAQALSQRMAPAAWILLGLAGVGAAYTLWTGAPPLAILPQVVAGILYTRAILALRFLRANAANGR